jgi:hypothetical protein
MGLEKKTAKVQINSKTKEIKEYEIQEGEVKNGSMFSKLKLPIILVMLVGISLAALKMIGAF